MLLFQTNHCILCLLQPCFYSQLRYDGFEAIASTLAKVVNIISACPPMARLHQVVNLGLQAEAEGTVCPL